MTVPFLSVRDVSFAYGRASLARPVLSNVSLDIERSSVVGLLGPNGSGKSTLMGIMSGVLSPRSGSVALDGRPVADMSRRDIARRIAVVPQETRATFDFTALEMVLMGRYPHLGPFELEGANDIEIARQAMVATGTSALEHRPFATLSGGEKQRVVIAGALAQASDMLLLDEPTAALDLRYQFEVVNVLKTLNAERKTTIVMSTHDLNLAAALVGSALGLSGVVFQALLRNPLASPDTLGLSAVRRSGTSTMVLLLGGVTLTALLSAVMSFVQFAADTTQTFRNVRWMMGSLDVASYAPIVGAMVPMLLAMAGFATLPRVLDLLSVGADSAASRGVDVARTERIALVSASLATGAAVSLAGPVTFVGIVVPHLVRLIVGADHRLVLPASALFGAALLIVCDLVARTIMAPLELPVGIVTAAVGSPVFLWLLFRRT